MPITGLVTRIVMGGGFHIVFLFTIAFFGLLGFYLLKIVLWNSFGREIISLNNLKTTFISDYKYFQNKVEIENLDFTSFSFTPVGYKEDNLGALVIGDDDIILESVVKIPINQLEELIIEILKANNQIDNSAHI